MTFGVVTLLLGRASVQTNERYLGIEEALVIPVSSTGLLVVAPSGPLRFEGSLGNADSRWGRTFRKIAPATWMRV